MPKRHRQKGRRAWAERPDDDGYVGTTEAPRGADLVDQDDPAFAHILMAARKLISLGHDPSSPEVARIAISLGRHDYAEDPRTGVQKYFEERGIRSKPRTDIAHEVVYYMRIGNRIKIGWSTNLPVRLATINPEELVVTEPGGHELEKLRHRQFRDLRVHGEWFRMEEPLISHMIDLQQFDRIGGR